LTVFEFFYAKRAPRCVMPNGLGREKFLTYSAWNTSKSCS
jgi:hypothetical protein